MDFTGAMRTVENSIGMSEAVKPFTHCDVGLKPNLVNHVMLSGMPAYVVRPLWSRRRDRRHPGTMPYTHAQPCGDERGIDGGIDVSGLCGTHG